MGARDVVFTILAIDAASATLEKVGLASEVTGTKFGTFGKLAGSAFNLVALGAGAAAIEGVKLGSTFQSSMEQLHTQAGVAQTSVDQLSGKVLDLAGKVGEDPNSLAEALYHVESSFASTGITGEKAMHLLQVSAEGAKVGHANLVDVTNALDAAVVSGIPGVQNFDQAMGALNATVGSGDMKMQDLADAFGTGVLASVKTYGLTLKDTGAALAVFGDNNIRGAEAGTSLRMAVQGFAVPAKQGKDALHAMGLESDTLAKAMAHGGLSEAMQVLTDHLRKAGIKGTETGQILTEAFGKKAGVGINILVDQYARLQSKYGEIDKASKNFGDDWAAQQKTFAQQWDELKATLEQLLTRLGLQLIPVLQKVAGFLVEHKTAVIALGIAFGTFVGVLATLGAYLKITMMIETATKLWKDAQIAFNIVMNMNPIGLIIIAIAALIAGIVLLWQHSATFRTIVLTAWADIKTATDAVVHGVMAAWDWLTNAFTATVAWFEALPGRLLAGIEALPGMLGNLFKQALDAALFALGYGIGFLVKESLLIPVQIIAAIQALPGLVEALFKKAWQLVVNVWHTLNTDLVTASVAIKDHLVSWASSAVSATVSFFSSMPDKIVAFVNKLPGMTRAALSDAGTWLLDAGKNVIQGLIQGITGQVSAAIAAVKHVGTQIISGIKSGLGISSPSKVMADEVGRWIPAGIAQGILAGMPSVSAALDGVSDLAIGTDVTIGATPTGVSGPATSGPAHVVNLYPQGLLTGSPAQLARELERMLKQAAGQGVRVNLVTT